MLLAQVRGDRTEGECLCKRPRLSVKDCKRIVRSGWVGSDVAEWVCFCSVPALLLVFEETKAKLPMMNSVVEAAWGEMPSRALAMHWSHYANQLRGCVCFAEIIYWQVECPLDAS